MGTGGVDIEKTRDMHVAAGTVQWRLRRTLGGKDLTQPSGWWNSSLEALLLDAHADGPQAIHRALAKHRPDLRAWVDALPDEERAFVLTTAWAPPKPTGNPSAVPPNP